MCKLRQDQSNHFIFQRWLWGDQMEQTAFLFVCVYVFVCSYLSYMFAKDGLGTQNKSLPLGLACKM